MIAYDHVRVLLPTFYNLTLFSALDEGGGEGVGSRFGGGPARGHIAVVLGRFVWWDPNRLGG